MPPGATATVFVPATRADQDAITEGGKPMAFARGVKLLRAEEDSAMFEVRSGDYLFACPVQAAG